MLGIEGAQILLVIGNRCTLRLLSSLFRAAGARVSGSSCGEQAHCKSYHFHPNLVIMDLELAWQGRWWIDTHVAFPLNLPVILLTTLCEELRNACGLEMQGVECVVKPFSPEALLTKTRQILDQ